MGVIIRQSLPSTVISYIGILIGLVNIVFLFPRFFEEDEFGLTRVLISVALIFSQFAEFGGSSIINKFFPYFKNKEKHHNGLLFWSFAIAFVFFIFFSGIFLLLKPFIVEFYSDKSALIGEFFYFVIPITFFMVYFNLFEAYARSHYKLIVPTFLREVYLRLFVFVSILLFYFDVIDFHQFVGFFVASYGSALVLILIYTYFQNNLFLSPKLSYLKDTRFKEVITFGFITILGSGVLRLVNNIDVLMISYLDPNYLGSVAVYSLAFYMVSFIQLPQRSLSQISMPIAAELIKKEDWVQTGDLYKKIALTQLIFGLFLFLGIWENIDAIYTFIPENFVLGIGVVFWIAIGKLVDMASGLNGIIIMYSRYYKMNLIFGILLLVLAYYTNKWLIPLNGIEGAAMATAISLIVFNVVKITFVYFKLDRLHPGSIAMLYTLVIASVIHFGLELLPAIENPFLSILIKGSIITIAYLGSIYYLELSADFNRIINNGLSKLKKA